jgi:uncharacterized protein
VLDEHNAGQPHEGIRRVTGHANRPVGPRLTSLVFDDPAARSAGSKRRDYGVLHALDADAVRRWYQWGLAALDATRDEINSLNVFPVADADTGTNLHLTLESAVQSPDAGTAATSPPSDSGELARTALSMARLSLLGARGSSGVILSQLLRGVAEVLAAERLPPRGLGLARALERAVSLAYAAVSHPVEGTMLTVARAAAEAARATGSDDLATVVGAAVQAAHAALDETPNQLDVLRRAGVVDAGGRGVVVLLDVLQAVVEERPLPALQGPIAHPLVEMDTTSGPTPAYEVMYLIDAPDDRIPRLRETLDGLGDSVVVSGGGGLWTVHVHTDDAGGAVDAGIAVGQPHRIRVTAISAHDQASAPGDGTACAPATADDGHAVVVLVAAGSPMLALHGVFAGAGAGVLEVTDSLADDLCGLGAAQVALLTDAGSGEVGTAVRAAGDALAARGVGVRIVSARSVVQLLAAVAVHDPHRPFDADVAAMTAAAVATRHADVRPDSSDGTRFVGIADGDQPVTGDDLCEVAVAVLERMLTDDVEMVTVVSAPQLCADIAGRIREAHADLDVVVIAADLGPIMCLGVE